MKKIAYVFLILFIASACKDMMKEQVYSTLTPANFYQNENDVMVAVNGVYDALQGPDVVDLTSQSQIMIMNLNIMMAGQMNNNWDPQFQTLVINNTLKEIWLLWAECYADVAKANGVIKAIEASSIDQALKDRYSAECRFIRAYCYFNQVRVFGHFPLVKNVPDNLNMALLPDSAKVGTDVYNTEYLKQVDRDEIYKFIVEELQFCESHLPAGYTAITDMGRITKGAASGMLARVYLFMAGLQYDYNKGGLIPGDNSKYALCAQKCQEIINSGWYILEPNFADIFDNAKENTNKEVMYAIKYTSSYESGGYIGEGSPWAPEWGVKGADITPKCYNQNQISMEFFADWKKNNGITDKRYTSTFQDTYINKKGQTITIPNGNFKGPLCPKMMSNFKHPLDPINDARDFGDDWIIQRYADVLLMQSEALNEVGGPNAASIDGVNQVRARAGKALITLPISKDDLRTQILEERKWELCFEGVYSWFDCVRTGRYVSEMTKYMNYKRLNQPQIINNIFPIPYQAMQANPSLKQNAGW